MESFEPPEKIELPEYLAMSFLFFLLVIAVAIWAIIPY